MEEKEIAQLAICNCGQPNLLWQPWRHLFRCGWCGRDYTYMQAVNLKRLSEKDYTEVTRLRNAVIAKEKGGD
jgi:hypothetical protein